jgi:hypothetical protein
MPGGMEEFPTWPAELTVPAASLVRHEHQRMRYFHPDQGPRKASPVGSAYPVLVGTLELDGAQKRAFEEFHTRVAGQSPFWMHIGAGEVLVVFEEARFPASHYEYSGTGEFMERHHVEVRLRIVREGQ